MPKKPAIIGNICIKQRHPRLRTFAKLLQYPGFTAGCCHFNSNSHGGINQWPPVSEELRQFPFLLLSKNLSVACLSCKRLCIDVHGHNHLLLEVLPLVGTLLYDSSCPFSQTQTLHRTGDSSPPLPPLIS